MAVSFNRYIGAGTLTRDPELRYTPGGTAVCDVSLAINEKQKNAAGEYVESTVFVECTLWGRTAEVACEYCKKGGSLLVEGRLKLDQWQDKEGQKRSRLKVVGERIQLLGGGKGGGQSGGQRSGGKQEPSGDTGYSGGGDEGGGPPDDSDLPF